MAESATEAAMRAVQPLMDKISDPPSPGALAVARAVKPAREVATYRYDGVSVDDLARSIDNRVAVVAELRYIRSSNMGTGVEAIAEPFRLLVDVGHEEWADFTSLYRDAS